MQVNTLDIIARLNALRDVRVGLPITSHRQLLGQVIVISKKVFRKMGQPFLNEALRKQALFNETLVPWVEHVQRRLSLMDDSVSALRHGTDARLRQLEERMKHLEMPLGDRSETNVIRRQS